MNGLSELLNRTTTAVAAGRISSWIRESPWGTRSMSPRPLPRSNLKGAQAFFEKAIGPIVTSEWKEHWVVKKTSSGEKVRIPRRLLIYTGGGETAIDFPRAKTRPKGPEFPPTVRVYPAAVPWNIYKDRLCAKLDSDGTLLVICPICDQVNYHDACKGPGRRFCGRLGCGGYNLQSASPEEIERYTQLYGAATDI